MTRRLSHLCGALACAAVVATSAACSTFTGNDAAAAVEGDEISRDAFEQYLGATASGAETVPAEAASERLYQLLVGRVIHRVLDAASIELTDEDRDAYAGSLPADDPFFSYSGDLQTDLLHYNVGLDALARVPAPPTDELAARYAQGPATIGLACYQSVIVATRGEAEAIVEQLRDGATLADTGRDPATISGTGSECTSFGQVWRGMERPEVVQALIDARPGVPTVIDGPEGWVVVDVPPFEQVRGSVEANYPAAAGQLLAIGQLATGDISIDPAYGRWDPATGTIARA